MNTLDKEILRAEVDANFAAFNKMSFKESDKGKFALLRKGKLVQICDIHSECCLLGDKKFTDSLYSVQAREYNCGEDLGSQCCIFMH